MENLTAIASPEIAAQGSPQTAVARLGGIQTPTRPPEALGGPSAPRCALYLRVSTEGQNIDVQRPDIDRLVAARGYEVVETYEEQASAVKARPAYERMLADAKRGRFTVLVVWALDRFGRSLQGNVNAILALDKLGVKIVSVREPWLDTAGPVRELLVAIFSWVAQQERARLIERTRAGIAVVRNSKPQWGRRSNSELVRSNDTAAIDAVIAANLGTGYHTLGKALGGCSPTTARKLRADYLKRNPPPLAQKTEATEPAPVELD